MSRTRKDTPKFKRRYWFLMNIPSWFKKARVRKRRRTDRLLIQQGKEPPRRRKDDGWDWW